MPIHTRVLTAAAMMLVLAAPAMAGEGQQRDPEGLVTAFPAGGPAYMTTVSDRGLLDEIAKMGIELPAGTMVAVHNGKAYLVKDARMADGKMLSEKVAR